MIITLHIMRSRQRSAKMPLSATTKEDREKMKNYAVRPPLQHGGPRMWIAHNHFSFVSPGTNQIPPLPVKAR
jgi:hypothetical protein